MTLAFSSACDRKKETENAPTEPWRRDEAEQLENAVERIRYRLLPEASLDLSLATKRTKPGGSIKGITGYIELDPNRLQFVVGELKVDLSRLEMDDQASLPEEKKRPKKPKIDEALETSLLESSWTKHARNWLGLGARAQKTKNLSEARFTIESARDLSHPRAEAGAVRADETGKHKHVRLVDATAVGTLKMRHISVARTVPVRILFFYDSEEVNRSARPSAIEVKLRGNLGVPLLEYDIRPRDDEANNISEMDPVLGYWVSNTALLSGSIRFEKGAF